MNMNRETLKTIVISIMATILCIVALAACTGQIQASQPTGGDYALNNQNQLFNASARAVGWHQPRQSTELENLLIRNMRYNNPNHKSYVYIYANNGAIKAYFPIVGKCTATDSSATSLWHATNSIGNNDTSNNSTMTVGSTGIAAATVDSPQLDGSYGGNEPGVFCFLDKPGHPMITFNGDYIMSDQYIPLKQAPELVMNDGRNGVNGHK